MKLIDIVNAKSVLEKLAVSNLPIKIAYRVSKILKKANIEYKDFDDTRISLIKKYGEVKEDGSFEVFEDKKQQFSEDISLLLTEDVKGEFFKLDIDEFPSSLELTPSEMSFLEPFLKGNETDKED